MGTILEKFRGRLPYASEMFGVFQPLLGWKSALTKARLATVPAMIPGLAGVAVVTPMEGRYKVALGTDYTALVNHDGVLGEQQGNADLFFDPPSRIRFRHPAHIDG